jgi:tetratricopeptide (TPR) repeat protein
MAETKPGGKKDAFEVAAGKVMNKVGGIGALLPIGLIVLLLGLTALYVYADKLEKNQTADWTVLTEALNADRPGARLSKTEDALDKLKGSPLLPTAQMLLAAQLHDKAIFATDINKSERNELLKQALSVCDSFLKNSADTPLLPKIMARRSIILEDSGDFKNAYSAFKETSATCRNTSFAFLKNKMIWGQARCAQKMGKTDDALSLADQCLRDSEPQNPRSWEIAARQFRQSLSKTPEDKNLLVKNVVSDEKKTAEDKPRNSDTKEPAKKPEK